MKKTVFSTFLFLSACLLAQAQDKLQEDYLALGLEEISIAKKGDRFLAVGAGGGISYGNLGAKLQWRISKTFGLSAGIGSRALPLSLPLLFTDMGEQDELLREHGLPFINKMLTGLSFNTGFDIWAQNIYIGFHYAQFGRWISLYDNRQQILHGYIMPVEGHIPLGKLPLAITIGGTAGFAFGKDKFLETVSPPNEYGGDNSFFGGIFLSFDLGIVYRFNY